MSLFSLLVLLVLFAAFILVGRSIVRTIRRKPGRFPVLSISLLAVSCVLLVASTLLLLFVSDTLGGALGGLASFFGLLESKIRHDREARQTALPQKES